MSHPVVVVGGGLGGLTAAVVLAQRGVKVTLLEKEPRLGGYAIAYRRGGYTFDLALHFLAGGEPGQEFHRLAGGLGLDGEVSFLRLKQGFRVLLGDYSFQMPNDLGALFDALEAEFPAERDALRACRKHVAGYARVYDRLLDGSVSKWRSLPAFILHLPIFLRHLSAPVKGYLERRFSDRRLMAILFQPATCLGVPMTETPVINFIIMFDLMLGRGLCTIAGGGQALTSALTRRLRTLGVDIVTGAKVERVLLNRNRAVGVRTDDGTDYAASAVVAGVNTPVLVEDLVGREHFPASYVKRLDALRPSVSVLVLNLGLDCHPSEVGIDSHITMAFPSEDVDGCMKRQRDNPFLDGFAITAHANTEPAIAPADRSVLSIVGGAAAEPWLTFSDDDYAAAKIKATEGALAAVEIRYPGLSDHVRVTDLVTPRTLQRYTGNPSGAIMGFECSCGMHRYIRGVSRIPIKGLYVANAWTGHFGGFMQVMKAGVAAAEKVIRRGARRGLIRGMSPAAQCRGGSARSDSAAI